MVTLSEREFLMVATGSAAAALMGMPAIALGQEKAAARVAEFLGGATAKEGGITLEMPEIAEKMNFANTDTAKTKKYKCKKKLDSLIKSKYTTEDFFD